MNCCLFDHYCTVYSTHYPHYEKLTVVYLINILYCTDNKINYARVRPRWVDEFIFGSKIL